MGRLKDIGVEGIATKLWGQPKTAAYAKRGDVILFDCGDGDALGICIGDKIAVMGQDGLVILPMSECLKAWSV
jgi:formylmethanofuran dehydrogenase subunit D